MANEQFDVTVIGSGPGGYVAAIRAGQLGLKVAIVEKDKRLGGTCTLRGCIPTKQLLMSAHVYEQMQHAADFGVQATGIQLAFADVQKRKDKVVMKNSKGIEYLMKKNKCTVFKGTGKADVAGQSRSHRRRRIRSKPFKRRTSSSPPAQSCGRFPDSKLTANTSSTAITFSN